MRTPEEFYKEEFSPENWEIVKSVRNANLFDFDSLIMFAEMYHKSEVKKLNIDDVSNCCPNCDSVDIEISKRCNECSAHFD
jgi:hypothetical protein